MFRHFLAISFFSVVASVLAASNSFITPISPLQSSSLQPSAAPPAQKNFSEIYDPSRTFAVAGVSPILRIGTRSSPLALAQAYETKRLLELHFPELRVPGSVVLNTMSTTGDDRLDIPLADIGGKGLFTKELDAVLMHDLVDLCVHSMKDVPTVLVEGTELISMLERENPSDVLISKVGYKSLKDLPPKSVVGTASLRRAAQVLHENPSVIVRSLRGNVQGRLRKLDDGDVDVTLLAQAGLNRLDMSSDVVHESLEHELMPAVAQGAIGIQIKSSNLKAKKYLYALNHQQTFYAVTAERSFLKELDGSCRTPIAGHATISADKLMIFVGSVYACDGSAAYDVKIVENLDEKTPEEIGIKAALLIKEKAGQDFLDEIKRQSAQIEQGWDMGSTA